MSDSWNGSRNCSFCFWISVQISEYDTETKHTRISSNTLVNVSSHGVGRYDSGDVWFTSQLSTQKQKKEKTIEKTIHNYKELEIKGTLQLSGVKLREVWLTGDDDFTKMSYVSTDYGTANEFLNGKHNGWILMYSYLMRMAVWCFALVAAIGMLRKRNPWNYVVMLTLLGGMIFHVFWEANPKYMHMLYGCNDVYDGNRN